MHGSGKCFNLCYIRFILLLPVIVSFVQIKRLKRPGLCETEVVVFLLVVKVREINIEMLSCFFLL